MSYLRLLLFSAGLLMLSWLLMQVVHEAGHIVGAYTTGGTVERVVLHPLQISRTDVAANPRPAIVVWLGPIIGCAVPVLCWLVVPRDWTVARTIGGFFAGFCLIANGAYIALGSFDRVGDCRVMLQTGSPPWSLWAFGLITIPAGLVIWHQLGSVGSFLSSASLIDRRMTVWVCALLAAVVCVELVVWRL